MYDGHNGPEALVAELRGIDFDLYSNNPKMLDIWREMRHWLGFDERYEAYNEALETERDLIFDRAIY